LDNILVKKDEEKTLYLHPLKKRQNKKGMKKYKRGNLSHSEISGNCKLKNNIKKKT